MLRIHIAVWLATLLVGCQKASIDLLEAPSTMQVVATSDYPAVVKVVLPGGYGICTGTFVSRRAVLTASHCTADSGTYTVFASFGRFETTRVESLGTGTVEDRNDIALLIFDEDVADPAFDQVIGIGEHLDQYEKVRLVGFGCNDINTRMGTGVKRTGTNQVYTLDDFIELISPLTAARSMQTKLSFGKVATRTTSATGRDLIGSENRAGTCFGDSGGPLLETIDGKYRVSGVTHAGGIVDDYAISQFVNLLAPDNYAFLNRIDDSYTLGVANLCKSGLPEPGLSCGEQSASLQILNFLKPAWKWVLKVLMRFQLAVSG